MAYWTDSTLNQPTLRAGGGEAKFVLCSHDAQAAATSIQANRRGYQGDLGVWNFGIGLPEGTVGQLQGDVLAHISFIIPLAGAAWPWVAGIGMCFGLLQTFASCSVQVYLVYQARGFGLWLILAAISMAFTILIIPIAVFRHIWTFPGTKHKEAAPAPDPDVASVWQQHTYSLYPHTPCIDDDTSTSGELAAKKIRMSTPMPTSQ